MERRKSFVMRARDQSYATSLMLSTKGKPILCDFTQNKASNQTALFSPPPCMKVEHLDRLRQARKGLKEEDKYFT